MATNKYGKPINWAKANGHFKLFMQIKKRVQSRFKQILEGDDEAIRYYCGKPNTNASDEDLAYIFDKEAIEQILTKLKENEAHGLAIFNGVRTKEDSRIGTTDEYNDFDGRPTLIIFPFKYVKPDGKETDSAIEILTNDGSEHPGTGGKGKKKDGSNRNEYEIPEIFEADQIHFK